MANIQLRYFLTSQNIISSLFNNIALCIACYLVDRYETEYVTLCCTCACHRVFYLDFFDFYWCCCIEKYLFRNGSQSDTCARCVSKVYFILFHRLKLFSWKIKKQNNHDINKNIRFFINLYLYYNLFKVQFNKATSRNFTWTRKNMDPGKHEIYMGWKNMSDFRELCFNEICVSTHKM